MMGTLCDNLVAGLYCPISSFSSAKERAVRNKGSNASTTTMIGNLVIENRDQAINIDQDHTKFGSWRDFVDGWLNYTLQLIKLGYSIDIIADRIYFLRWLTDADYTPQSKLLFMYHFRTQFPENDVLWWTVLKANSILIVTYLKPFDSDSPAPRPPTGNPTGNPRNPRDRKRGKNGSPKNPKPTKNPKNAPKPTSANKQAQLEALKALNKGRATPLRLCFASSSSKACTNKPCTFAHICIKCAGDHTRSDCQLP
jgi:hypothetical protein